MMCSIEFLMEFVSKRGRKKFVLSLHSVSIYMFIMPIDWFTFETEVEKEGRNLNTAMQIFFLSTTEVDFVKVFLLSP